MLDEQKRQQIIALVANGSSRRIAARYVGCAPSTITRAVARDPDFARQLAAAEQTAEIDALRALRGAARKDRYWRAAAWLLERKNPEDFAHRPPNLFTGDEVLHMFTQIIEVLCDEVPEDNCDRAMKKLEEIIDALQQERSIQSIPPASPKFSVQHPSAVLHELTTPTLSITPTPACSSDEQH